MARWESGTVTAFEPRPAGAGFAASEQPFLGLKIPSRPLCLDQGPDGALLMTVCKMVGNEVSPWYPSELYAGRPAVGAVPPPFGGGVAAATVEDLYGELSHGLWCRRQAAHQELIRRGPAALAPAAARLGASPGGRTKAHLAWLAALADPAAAGPAVHRLARGPDRAARLNAVRILAAFPTLPGRRTAWQRRRATRTRPFGPPPLAG